MQTQTMIQCRYNIYIIAKWSENNHFQFVVNLLLCSRNGLAQIYALANALTHIRHQTFYFLNYVWQFEHLNGWLLCPYLVWKHAFPIDFDVTINAHFDVQNIPSFLIAYGFGERRNRQMRKLTIRKISTFMSRYLVYLSISQFQKE